MPNLIVQVALISTAYAAVSIMQFEWMGVVSRSLLLALSLYAIALVEKSDSIGAALKAACSNKSRALFVYFFSAINVAFGIYYDFDIVRIILETIFVFNMFLAFSAVGGYLKKGSDF